MSAFTCSSAEIVDLLSSRGPTSAADIAAAIFRVSNGPE
jgi:hypothetical protein